MPVRKIIRMTCLVISTTCLAAGCLASGQWNLLAGCGILLLVSLFPRKWLPTGFATAALVATVCLAGTALVSGASAPLMILGTTIALAGWDLAALDQTLTTCPSSRGTALLEKKHYESLGLALGAGLAAAAAVRFIRFEIPFGVMVLVVVLALFCLDGLWRSLNDGNR